MRHSMSAGQWANIRVQRDGANQTVVQIGGRTYYFSYSTCVALCRDGERYRRDQTYSRTTAKHMTQWGVKGWPQVSDAEFESAAAIETAAG